MVSCHPWDLLWRLRPGALLKDSSEMSYAAFACLHIQKLQRGRYNRSRECTPFVPTRTRLYLTYYHIRLSLFQTSIVSESQAFFFFLPNILTCFSYMFIEVIKVTVLISIPCILSLLAIACILIITYMVIHGVYFGDVVRGLSWKTARRGVMPLSHAWKNSYRFYFNKILRFSVSL